MPLGLLGTVGAPGGFQGQLGQLLPLLQPVSHASGLLFCPAEPTAFSRRHLIIAAMQPSWRQFREEQQELCGAEGAWCWRWRQGGGVQSRPRLRHLAQPGPAGNLRSTASVCQRLEKGLRSKGRNKQAGKTEGRGLLHTTGQGPRPKPAQDQVITLSSLECHSNSSHLCHYLCESGDATSLE